MRMNWKRIMMPLGVLLFGAMVAIACSDSESETGNTGDGDLPAENVTVRINPNKTRVLRNPLNGWVLYLAREKNETFWEERGYDHMYVPDLAKYVKVSDYASSCYLRTNWKTLEPQKGKYAWDDPSSDISRIIKSVHDRGLRIALRVLVDGRDQNRILLSSYSMKAVNGIIQQTISVLILMTKCSKSTMESLSRLLPANTMTPIR